MIKLLMLALSGAKLGKVLLSGGSMLLSLGLYAWVFGWRYAAGLVALLLLHEMGHFIAARHRGLAVGWPTFLPFVGAWVVLKDRPLDAGTDAFVAFGGPLLGSAAALVAYLAARDTGAPWLLAVAYAGFLINLINLAPVPWLDGGRITGVLSPRLWVLGVPLMLALFAWTHSPLLLLLALLALPQAWRGWRGRAAEDQPAGFYDVSPATRWGYAALYLLLCAWLGLMSHEVHGRVEAARAAPPATELAPEGLTPAR